MSKLGKEITSITIESELKRSYMDYAMSVIIGRALPDVRDGLKPVHRRSLYAMKVLNNDWNKAYKKSARIVGDVIGKYHPHGDNAVYDTIVRMAQPFSLRYMLVDGQGNFGSVDGDSPAAMRYTEIRLSRLAHWLLADLEKDTVDFVPNYDGTEQMPSVMPTRIPNLLVNGSSGIAVGMATNIPPHNLAEVINATLAVLDDSEIGLEQLLTHIPGPDFPTAAIINGRGGIVQAYKTGRGRIYVRAKTEIEVNESTHKSKIIVHELPYQVNKARLLERIGELVRDKKIEGISALRDESDKRGMRMVIELRRGEQAEVVLNNLYAQTQLQTVFGINIVALHQGQPKIMTLKDMLDAFLQHRREVVTRRTLFELNKARARAHLLEGLAVALANIDEVIALIKAAKNPAEAKAGLLARAWESESVKVLLERASAESRPDDLDPNSGLRDDGYYLSPVQAQAILDLRLHRLTGLEVDKLHKEYNELMDQVIAQIKILSEPDELHRVIRQELQEVKDTFADERRTEIVDTQQDLTHEDLITEQNMVVTLSSQGYIKAQAVDVYSAQRRGGRGKVATTVKEEDFVRRMLVVHSHDTILCFSTFGKVYWLKTYQVPQGGRTARGRPVVNLLPLSEGERGDNNLAVKEYTENHFVFMTTLLGTVKKVALTEFARQRSSGKVALDLVEDDRLIGAVITDGEQDIMLVASSGKAIRFREADVRAMGRSARGVRGIRLAAGEQVVKLILVKPSATLLTATENGYGQRTAMEDYRAIGRGGQGVRAIVVNERNGIVVSAAQVFYDDEVLMITNAGTMIRTRVNEISVIGRNTQGVRLVNLSADEKLTVIASIPSIEEPE